MNKLVEMLAVEIIHSGALRLRDVDAGEEPFLYSSGYRGPGYVTIKSLVSRTLLRDALVAALATEILEGELPWPDFVAGNVTGGVPIALVLGQELTRRLGRYIPMVYVRGTRKRGGLQEHVTGIDGLPLSLQGLVVEELVNFAVTTVNSAHLLRECGHAVHRAGCVLSYDSAACRAALREADLALSCVLTLEELLSVADEVPALYPKRLVEQYRAFLLDPDLWMAERGLQVEPQGGTL